MARSDLRAQILLLAALVSVLALQPFVRHMGLAGGLALQVAFFAALVFGANIGRPAPRMIAVVRVAAGAALVGGTVVQFYQTPWLSLLVPALYIAAFGLVIARLLAFVLGDSGVSASRLCGGISAYVMIGVAWGLVYLLAERVTPGSFSAGGVEPLDASDLVYFSLVTLSTLGYGDIAPAAQGVRSLATLEALAGQLYLAVLVARLVGLGGRRRGPKEQGAPDSR